jgi:hypothetical protein
LRAEPVAEPPRAEPVRVEPPRAEPVRVEPPHVEPLHVEPVVPSPRIESLRVPEPLYAEPLRPIEPLYPPGRMFGGLSVEPLPPLPDAVPAGPRAPMPLDRLDRPGHDADPHVPVPMFDSAPPSAKRAPRTPSDRRILQVNAVRCPDGHENPPSAVHCRVCRRMIDEDAERFELTQPTIGQLRLVPGETTFPLRGRVLVGREPRLIRPDTMLSDAANLTDVALFPVVSTTGLVSRTHIEVRVTGWTVEVIDLSSTHTVVTNPGGQPIRLRSGNPTVILPDARIVLADEITLVYQVVA